MKLVKVTVVTVLVLLMLPVFARAQKKPKKPSVPAVFDHARYVYVEAMDGDEFKPGLTIGDRTAIADLRDALRAWGRYSYTSDMQKADLVFVVRRGQLAAADMGGGRMGGNGAGRSPSIGDMPASQSPGQFPGQDESRGGMNIGGEAGPPEDLLEVCQVKENGKLSSPLWMRSMANGLQRPQMLLFSDLKDAVDKSYPPDTTVPPVPVVAPAPAKP